MARTETAPGTNAGAPHPIPNGEKKTRGPRKAKAPAAVYVMVQFLNESGLPMKPEGEIKVTVVGDAHAALVMQQQNPGAIIAFGYAAAS